MNSIPSTQQWTSYCLNENHPMVPSKRPHSRIWLLVISVPLFLNSNVRSVHAALSSPHSYKITLPDGSESPPMTIKGSPAYSQTVDETSGYTVMVDPEDGFAKYAMVDQSTGELKPSNVKMRKAGKDDSSLIDELAALGIEKGATATDEAKRKACGDYCKEEVDAHEYVPPPPKTSPGKCRMFCSSSGVARRLGNSGREWGRHLDGMLEQHVGFKISDWMPESISNFISSWIDEDEEDDEEIQIKDQGYHRRQQRKLGIVNNKLKNLVILFQFADHASDPQRKLINRSSIDTLFNAVGGDPDLAPTGSIRDVFATSSYGKLIVESVLIDKWIKISGSEKYYAGGKSGFTTEFSQGLTETLQHLDDDPNFDFSYFDANGDKVIDSITFLHSGYGAEWGGVDCYNNHAPSDRIWSHKWSLREEFVSKKSGVRVKDYHVSPAMYGVCGSDIGRIGTMAHELGHFLGLPDLYGGDPPSGGNGIGSFGLMGNSWGWDGSQFYPPLMDPWCKVEMGWLEPAILSDSGRYDLPPVIDSPKVYKITRGFKDDEYLLIENRGAKGFDAKMPKGGLMVWHIDDRGKHRPESGVGHPGFPGWPGNGAHYRVSVLPADGSYGLEKGENRGDEGDIFGPNDSLGTGFQGEGSATYPNTDSYQEGVITPTGIKIYSISDPNDDPDGYIKFTVLFPGDTLPETDPPTFEPTAAPGIELLQKEVMTNFGGGTGSYGAMLDVVAINDLNITSMDLHLRSSPSEGEVMIEIYTLLGSYIGNERSPESWTKVCCNKKVVGQGLTKRTVLDPSYFTGKIPVSKGERRAFYITSDVTIVRYSSSEFTECCQIYSNTADIQVYEGSGVGGYPFGGHLKPRIWNGVFHYETYGIKTKRRVATKKPTARPTLVSPPASSGTSSPMTSKPTDDPLNQDSSPTPGESPGALNSSHSLTNLKAQPPAKTKIYSGNSGSYGIMFDVIPQKEMIITGFDFHTDAKDENVEVEVWTRRGTHIGYERDQFEWTQICSAEVTGAGPYMRTTLDESVVKEVYADAFERISFYMTLTAPKMRYTKVDETVNIVVGDISDALTDIHILVGSGIGGYPFGHPFTPRLWNGSIRYSVSKPEATSEPTPGPTPAATGDIYTRSDKMELSTTFSSGNGGFGSMFDVTSKTDNDLVISSLDFHTDLTDSIKVTVWTIPSSYVGFGYQKRKWSIVADTKVTGQGYYKRTVIPDDEFTDVVIPGGQTQGFYVTIDRPNLRYSNAKAVGDVWSQNGDLSIKVGAGVGSKMSSFTGLYEPRMFNGVVHYFSRDYITPSPTSASPTLSPVEGSITGGLRTPLDGESGSYGAMFTIRNRGGSSILITSLGINTNIFGEVPVEVYTVIGDFSGIEQSPEKWTRLCQVLIEGSGSGEISEIHPSKFQQVQVEPNEKQSFYVTLDRPNLHYSQGSSPGAVLSSDEYLEVYEGVGVGGYPFGSTFSPRSYNGVVHYRVVSFLGSQTSPPTSPPKTDSPTTSPETTAPTAHPTRVQTTSPTSKPTVSPTASPTSSAPVAPMSGYRGNSLWTTFEGGTGAYGVLFDIVSLRSLEKIRLFKIALHAYGDPMRCEVWYRKGSALDYPWNTDGGGWINVADTILEGIGGESDEAPRRVFPEDEFTPIIIDPGETIGILAQCEEDRVRYSTYQDTGSDGVIAMSTDLKIMLGYGVTWYPLMARVQFDRVFNGGIFYEVFR